MKFLTMKEFEAYNWKSHFKDVKVTADIDFTIGRTGTLISTSQIISTGGERKNNVCTNNFFIDNFNLSF